MIKNIIYIITLLLAILTGNNCSYSQISTEGSPIGQEYLSLSASAAIVLPEILIDDIFIKSQADAKQASQPFTFAELIETNIDVKTDGSHFRLDNGDHLYIVKVISHGANSLNLTFTEYLVPDGAKVFVYSPNQDHILGAFSSHNIKSSGILAVGAVKGDEIIIEYLEPKNAVFKGKLVIGKIGHDFIGIIGQSEKDGQYGNSGECNVDVACEEALDWQYEKNAVVKIIINNTELCTGSLVANTEFDNTPYLLTANHCISYGDQAQNSVYYFKYENTECDGNEDPYPVQSLMPSISGATLHATTDNLDFCLVELSEMPPQDYFPYFLGWDNTDTTPAYTTCIHHPSGDVKKITFDNDNPTTTSYSGYDDNTHWWIHEWDMGTTEGGSSGAPLFNEQHRIIGDLTGGQASCTYNYNDYFAKFSNSWDDYFVDESTNLKAWLDPDNSGALYIDGYNPYNTNQPPVANFCAQEYNIPLGMEIDFKDLSTYSPISWQWSFEGGSPSTSNQKNPQNILFEEEGSYTVSLVVSNSYGVDTIIFTDYITISDYPKINNLSANLQGRDVFLNWSTPEVVNELFENFETYPDYTLNFAPWEQYDGDQSTTYVIDGYEFTNQGYVGSFIIFKPTNPLGTVWNAYSGQKYAACFNAENPPNNDWLISPSIELEEDATLSFWAKSVTSQYGLERFKVRLAIESANPEDFILISEGNYLEAPVDWTFYNYDLSEYTGETVRIAIQCISNDAFVFMVDEVQVESDNKILYSNSFETEPSNKNKEIIFQRASAKNDYKYKFQKIAISKGRLVPKSNPYKRIINPKTPESSNKDFSLAGYSIYRNDKKIAEISNPATTFYVDATAPEGISEYYVRALYENPDGASLPSNIIEIDVPADILCDTVTNMGLNDSLVIYIAEYASEYGGYVSGNNVYGDLAKAEYFSQGSAYPYVYDGFFLFGVAIGNSNTSIRFSVLEDNLGSPGQELTYGIKTLGSIKDDVANQVATYVTFNEVAHAAGPYYLAVTLPQNPDDSLALLTNSIWQASVNTAWEKNSGGEWHPYNDYEYSWQLTLNHAVYSSACTGVDIFESKTVNSDRIKVYPNPFTSSFTVFFEKNLKQEASIQIFDAYGRQLFINTLKAGITEETFELFGQPNGIYLLRINTPDQSTIHKIILTN